MKKKKIASNMNDIILSEIDLKETTFKNNDVVYYSLDVVSDNSSNNSDKSLNLDDYDLNIEDFKVEDNHSEIKNISIDNNYSLKNFDDNFVDNNNNNNNNDDNIDISTNKLLNEVQKESLMIGESVNNINNNTDTSKIKLNTSEFFNILNNQSKQKNTHSESLLYQNNQQCLNKNSEKVDLQDNVYIVTQNDVPVVKQNDVPVVKQNDVQVVTQNDVQVVTQNDVPVVTQNDVPVVTQNDVQVVTQNNVQVVTQNVVPVITQNDVPVVTQNNVPVIIEENKIQETISDDESNTEIKKADLDNKPKNLEDIETKDKLNIWKDLIESKDNLYSSYNYLQTETQSNNLIELISKNILYKFYKLAENNNKNISGYIDEKKILNCKQNITYKYEVHTKITNTFIDPPGNYINILFNKDLNIIKCIFLLNSNGYWTLEPMENFVIFKNDIIKQKILLTYFIILKILFCNKYYPFNEGNSIQKYRNLTKNINLNIINHIKKNNKFKEYIDEQLKNVYKQEDNIDNIINIVDNNNINKYYGRILKLKYKYY